MTPWRQKMVSGTPPRATIGTARLWLKASPQPAYGLIQQAYGPGMVKPQNAGMKGAPRMGPRETASVWPGKMGSVVPAAEVDK